MGRVSDIMSDSSSGPSVTITAMVEREDGSFRDFSESFCNEYLTEAQFERVMEGVASAVLTPMPAGDTTGVDTSRMFGGDA